MDVTGDELAGVVDLFGGLTRAELERALAEAAFRADGENVDEDALADAIDGAVDAFALVRYGGPTADAPSAAENRTLATDHTEPLLVAGPTAFPRVPEGAEDVPHILDVERRRLDREALGEAVRDRFAAAVADALGEDGAGENDANGTRGGDEDETRGGDVDRVRHLLEVSYDVEAWAPVDVGSERARLEAALEEG